MNQGKAKVQVTFNKIWRNLMFKLWCWWKKMWFRINIFATKGSGSSEDLSDAGNVVSDLSAAETTTSGLLSNMDGELKFIGFIRMQKGRRDGLLILNFFTFWSNFLEYS